MFEIIMRVFITAYLLAMLAAAYLDRKGDGFWSKALFARCFAIMSFIAGILGFIGTTLLGDKDAAFEFLGSLPVVILVILIVVLEHIPAKKEPGTFQKEE